MPQTEHRDGVKAVFTSEPLSDEFMKQWELNPAIHRTDAARPTTFSAHVEPTADAAQVVRVVDMLLAELSGPDTFAAPGPPPRDGLVWNDGTHRWRNPHTGEEHPHPPPKADEHPPLAGRDAEVDEASRAHVAENYPAVRAAYLAKNAYTDPATGDVTSVVMNTDEFREHLPGYVGTNAGAVHEAASAANKKVYAEMLQSQKGKGNNTRMVLAGGGGSGKGTAVGDYFDQNRYPLVLDQVSDNLAKLEQKLDEATANGYATQYVFVDRPAEDAWGGVTGRAIGLRKKGKLARTVPLEVALKANIASRRTALELLKKRPDIKPNIIDNTGRTGRRRLITNRAEAVAYLEKRLAEDEAAVAGGLEAKLRADIARRHAAGDIPDDIAAGFVGAAALAANKGPPT